MQEVQVPAATAQEASESADVTGQPRRQEQGALLQDLRTVHLWGEGTAPPRGHRPPAPLGLSLSVREKLFKSGRALAAHEDYL